MGQRLKPLFEPEPTDDPKSRTVSWDIWGTKGYESIPLDEAIELMLTLTPEAQALYDSLGLDLTLDAIDKMERPETSTPELTAWIGRERKKLEEIRLALIPTLQWMRDKGFTFGPDYWEKADEADPIPKKPAGELTTEWIEPYARVLTGEAPPEVLEFLSDYPDDEFWRLKDKPADKVRPFERRSTGLKGMLALDELLQWAQAHRERLAEISDRQPPSYEQVHRKVAGWLRSLQRSRFELPEERMTANDVFFFALPALLRESADRLLRVIFRPDLKPGSVKLSRTGESLLPWIANTVPGARGAILRLFGSIPQPSKEAEWGTFFGIADPRKSPGFARLLGIQIATAWADMTAQPVGLAIWRCRNGRPQPDELETGSRDRRAH